jgi:poly(3-hydroxybutyrate) depolymerase
MLHAASRAKFALLALLLLPVPAYVQAQAAPAAVGSSIASLNRIQSKAYFFAEAGLEMPYELYVPTTYDPALPARLIIALHGLGSNPAQVIRYQGLVDLAEERGYIVAAPMGYNSRGWYGSRGEGRASARGDAAEDPENLGALSEKDVMNVLDIVRRDYNIDPERIFLMGHSMGGGGTWHIAMKNPDLFAALGPVAPAIYSSPDSLSAIRHIPVIVVMGDEDALVRVDVTRQWVAKMKELGMRYSYVEIPGGDHTRIIARNPANMQKIFDFFDEVSAN